MDYRYGWHIRSARPHDSDHRLGNRVIIRPRESSHPRTPAFAPPQFHQAGPPIQLSQDSEREDGNGSADMSISEESADDDLHIAQVEQPALAGQEEISVHQEVDVELELSLTGGRKKKIQRGTSARVDATPSGADIHPFLSLSISPPSTTVTAPQPPPPSAPSSRPGQSSDDVGKAGIGGLPLNLGNAMLSTGLTSQLVQGENKETFREAPAEDVDWDWRERLVQGATSGRGKEERSVHAVSDVEAGTVESRMVINNQCAETVAVMNTETTREVRFRVHTSISCLHALACEKKRIPTFTRMCDTRITAVRPVPPPNLTAFVLADSGVKAGEVDSQCSGTSGTAGKGDT